MYEYDPKSPKKKEKLLLFALLFGAALLFGVSHISDLPIPALPQLGALFCLVGTVMITGRCLLRRFVYRVDVREDGNAGDPPDLTVTEYYGNHVSVVCRISVADIETVTHITPQNRKELSEMLRQKRVYHYTACLFSDELYLLTVRDEDEVFYIRILADHSLLAALKK